MPAILDPAHMQPIYIRYHTRLGVCLVTPKQGSSHIYPGVFMRLHILRVVRWAVLGGLAVSGAALACDQGFDGCLGCNDNELQTCLNSMVQEICKASGNPANCDAARAYDDAERNVIISTGSHMSHISSMMRSARKYQLH